MNLALPNSISVKKRLLVVLLSFSLIIFLLIMRVAWLQIVQGSFLQKKAHENQTRDNVINAQRGTIYDRNGNELAVSASVETVILRPNQIKGSKTIKPEEVAQILSNILKLDYNDVYAKATKKVDYVALVRRIDKPIADEVRKIIAEKKIAGVEIIDDKKRFYPNSNFASYILGFTGDDSQGLNGIELKYEKYLKGSSGRIISAADAQGREIPFSEQQYQSPISGNNIYLTIDETIQHFAEKALENAVVNTKSKKGTVIVMDPKTGEILAMASKPDFNLNDPFNPMDETMKNQWSTLDTKDRNTELQKMWRNPAISDTYEPGSTFKMVTSAAALEEGVVKTTDMFNCIGYAVVSGSKMRCHVYPRSHGVETFIQGVQNSCNPVFIEVAQRLGAEKFYNYIKGFGFMEKTGIDLPGENGQSIFHKLSAMGPVELATYSFGQGFQITPMQMIQAISTIANDGKMVKPHIVKQIKEQQGNIVKSYEPEFVRQVISKDTSILLRSILESVVSSGTGKNAYVRGYRVAGKTGTSEKLPRGTSKYVASFGAFAPADDPKIAVLVLLDEPDPGNYYGGQIAAPVVGQIISDTLTYMNVEPRYTEEELTQYKEIIVPDVRKLSLNDATKTLKGLNITYKVEGQGDAVVEQMPRAGVKISQSSPVFLFLSKESKDIKKTVPNVIGMSVADASKAISDAGLNIKAIGDGKALSQSIASGTLVEPGTTIGIEFRNTEIQD